MIRVVDSHYEHGDRHEKSWDFPDATHMSVHEQRGDILFIGREVGAEIVVIASFARWDRAYLVSEEQLAAEAAVKAAGSDATIKDAYSVTSMADLVEQVTEAAKGMTSVSVEGGVFVVPDEAGNRLRAEIDAAKTEAARRTAGIQGYRPSSSAS